MSGEVNLRWAVLLVGIGTGVIAAYFRRRARTGEPISHREEGYAFTAALRLLGLALWIVLIAYLVDAEWVRRFQLSLPLGLRWCGIGLSVAGTSLMRWTLAALGKNLTDTVVTRRDAELVTSGPYRYVRHPFYTTTAMVMFGIALAAANWLLGLICVAVWSMLAVRTPLEERKLIERFGDDYRRYMATTGRFFPKIAA